MCWRPEPQLLRFKRLPRMGRTRTMPEENEIGKTWTATEGWFRCNYEPFVSIFFSFFIVIITPYSYFSSKCNSKWDIKKKMKSQNMINQSWSINLSIIVLDTKWCHRQWGRGWGGNHRLRDWYFERRNREIRKIHQVGKSLQLYENIRLFYKHKENKEHLS